MITIPFVKSALPFFRPVPQRGAVAVVKTDNTVDFPTIYLAIRRVIDVVDLVIPGHGITFSLGIGGERRNLFQVENRF